MPAAIYIHQNDVLRRVNVEHDIDPSPGHSKQRPGSWNGNTAIETFRIDESVFSILELTACPQSVVVCATLFKNEFRSDPDTKGRAPLTLVPLARPSLTPRVAQVAYEIRTRKTTSR